MVKELPDGNYEVNINPWLVSIIIMLVFFLAVIFIQMRKYGNLLHASRKIVSKNYYGFLHDFRKGDSSSGFYQGNLLEYAKRLEEAGKAYRNTTEQYWKYYKGTIVAPIRVARERLHYMDSDDDFDVIGFCV